MAKATSTRKNVLLNNGQRYEIYKHYKESFQSTSTENSTKESTTEQDQKQNDQAKKKDGMTYGELINWAVDRYKLERRPNKSTISKMISRMDEERALGGPERKRSGSRIHKGRFPEVEEAVLEWMDVNESKRIPVTWTMILQKANSVAERRGLEFKGSNGWMDRFIARHDLKRRVVRINKDGKLVK